MTYRGSLPPGQAWDGQGQDQQGQQQQQQPYMQNGFQVYAPAAPPPPPQQQQQQQYYEQGGQQYIAQQPIPQYGYQGYVEAQGQGYGGGHQMQQSQYAPPPGVWQQPSMQQQQEYAFQQQVRQHAHRQQQQLQHQHHPPQQPQQHHVYRATPQQLQQQLPQPQQLPSPRPPSVPQAQAYIPPQPNPQPAARPQPQLQPQQHHQQPLHQQHYVQPQETVHSPAQQMLQSPLVQASSAQFPDNRSPQPPQGSFQSPTMQIAAPQQPPEQHAFVNLQDIQQPPPPRPVAAVQQLQQQQQQHQHQHVSHTPLDTPETPNVHLVNQEPMTTMNPADMMINKVPPPQAQKMGTPRIKQSPRSSVSNSPALTARSPSISKKSPAISNKPRPVDTIPIMVAVAEECIEKARASVHDVAMSLDPIRVDEHQRLICTALACLEAALQSSRLSPRQEARVRLRYAAVLREETENLMEAETALSKGITLCDKHRMFDLKYCMQYVMLQVLFQRSNKAALNAVDRHISDCEAFRHVHWVYAFRLLKASFYIDGGHTADASSLENIRAIQNIANTRGDNALSVFASILEGLTLLKTSKDGNIERVQACLAQAAKFQFDPSVHIMQLDILTLLLDLAASINYQSPDITSTKLRTLQKRLDECGDWHNVRADFLLPIKKQPSTSQTLSEDTAAIVQAGDGDGQPDFLVLSFMTKMELMSLVFTFSGLTSLHKASSSGLRSAEFWQEGLKILDSWDTTTAGIRYGPAISLNEAVKQRGWRLEAQAYLNVLLGLLAASRCQWDRVKQCVKNAEITQSTQSILRLLALYLSGVYYQGTGNLATALSIFQNSNFDPAQTGPGIKATHREIALLAALNRLWIMQHPSQRDDRETSDLLEQLQPLCINHTNVDLRTAWHNVMAAIDTDPPQHFNQQKQHIQTAMAGSRSTSNVLGTAVTLNIMRSRLFENVIGEQALKSALAAARQAQRSGNVLWQSVADGMLAQSYEVQGQRDEATREWEKATREASEAFAGSGP